MLIIHFINTEKKEVKQKGKKNEKKEGKKEKWRKKGRPAEQDLRTALLILD